MKDTVCGKGDDTITLMRTVIPFEWQHTEKERLLFIAFNPTENELLNIAQLHVLSVFADFLETDNDAVALRFLLHNRLICCISDNQDMCIQHPEYAGDFFRLLLMYFNPTFTFLLDRKYPNWEDEMGSLLLNPTSCFSLTQVLFILESLQGVEVQSVMWLMLWFVDVMSLHHGPQDFYEASFQVVLISCSYTQQFLQDATSSSSAVSLLSIAQLLQHLPTISQDFIVCSIVCLKSRVTALPTSHGPFNHHIHNKHPPSHYSLASPMFSSSPFSSIDRRSSDYHRESAQVHGSQ